MGTVVLVFYDFSSFPSSWVFITALVSLSTYKFPFAQFAQPNEIVWHCPAPYYQVSIILSLSWSQQHFLKRNSSWDSLNAVNTRLHRAEERNPELEDASKDFLKLIHKEKQRLGREKGSEYPRTMRQPQKVWYLCNRDTRNRKRGAEEMFLVILAGNSPKLMTGRKPQAQEAQRTPSRKKIPGINK